MYHFIKTVKRRHFHSALCGDYLPELQNIPPTCIWLGDIWDGEKYLIWGNKFFVQDIFLIHRYTSISKKVNFFFFHQILFIFDYILKLFANFEQLLLKYIFYYFNCFSDYFQRYQKLSMIVLDKVDQPTLVPGEIYTPMQMHNIKFKSLRLTSCS